MFYATVQQTKILLHKAHGFPLVSEGLDATYLLDPCFILRYWSEDFWCGELHGSSTFWTSLWPCQTILIVWKEPNHAVGLIFIMGLVHLCQR